MVDPARTSALDLVLELTVLLDEDMRTGLAKDGLTGSRAHLLWVLRERGPCTQRELADALGISPRGVTGLVDVLETTGFVTRRPHPTDRRASLVGPTDHGERVTARLAAGHEELADQLFGDLPEERLRCLTDGLQHVLHRLREQLAAPEVTGA